MDMISAMAWFTAGALIALVVRHVFFLFEVGKIVKSVFLEYFKMSQKVKIHLTIALEAKKRYLKQSNLPEKDLDDIFKKDSEFIENWDFTATRILLTSIPKRYYNYFNSTNEE